MRTIGILHPLNNILRVKLSGDGYKRSENAGHVVWTFSLLDMEQPHSALATWDFAVANTIEKYEPLLEISWYFQKSIQDIILTGANLNGELFTVDLYLSADQKFLLFILGLKGATSKYWCVWCEISKEDKSSLQDMGKVVTH